MESDTGLEELGSGHQKGDGRQQVAIVNEHNETIYIQLPPNVTLDDYSVVTAETTEDGQQIFRVIGVSEQPGDSQQQMGIMDGDASLLHSHQDMEADGQDVAAMVAEDSNVTILQPRIQEVPHARDQVTTIVNSDSQEVSVMEPEIQEVTLAGSRGQEVTILDSESHGVAIIDSKGQEATLMDSDDQVVAVRDVEGEEVTVMSTSDKEVTVMTASDQEVTVIVPSDEQVAVTIVDGCNQEITDMDSGGREATSMEAEGHEAQIIEGQQAGTPVMQGTAENNLKVEGTADVEPSSANDSQDVAVFQQALAMFYQQNEGVAFAEGEGGNTVYVLQRPKEEVEDVAEMEQMATEGVVEESVMVEPTETVNIINPETGKVEAVNKLCLDSSANVGPVSELTAPTDVVGLTNLLPPDPVIITPVKRRPGRPRKDKSARPPPRSPLLPTLEEVEDVGPPGPGGRPRRKAALKFFKKWAAMRQDLGVEKPEPDVPSSSSLPNQALSAAQLEERQAAKEKRAQAAKEKKIQKEIQATKDPPAVVNVKIKDQTTIQVMSDIGLHMLYYCRRCTFFSTQILAVTNHVLACRQRTLTVQDQNQAADASHTSAVLLNAALQDIAKSAAETPKFVSEDDSIQIDEHNYAAEEDGEEAKPADTQCHKHSKPVELEQLPAHLHETHPDADGEETARRLVEVDSNLHVNKDDSGSLADERSRSDTEPDLMGSKSRFCCPDHEMVLPNQAALTQHYIEMHSGVTRDKVAASEACKQKNIAEHENKVAVVKKRGRGRPRKYPVTMKPLMHGCIVEIEDVNEEMLSNHDNEGDVEHDDDVKDPDFDIKTASDASATAAFKDWPEFRGKGTNSKCMHCYKRFATPASLKLHMKHQHTGDKLLPVQCQFCEKSFRNKVQLRNHVRCVHEGTKRRYVYKHYPVKKKVFMCEECGYTTPELCRLKNHKLSVHEGQYPYVCDICDYKTNEKADMRRHEHKHQGIKRYPCTYCNYRSDQRWLLVNHCQRQHSIRLDRQSRNTRGSFWSSRRMRKEEPTTELPGGDNEASLQLPEADMTVVADADAPIAYSQEIIIEQGISDFPANPGDSYLVPMVTTNENGEEEMAMYAVRRGIAEQDGAMYAVGQDSGEQDGAMYVVSQESVQQDESMYVVRQDDEGQDGAMYVVSQDSVEQDGAMYVVGQDATEQEVAMETIEAAQGEDVVYIQEDGTVLEREQAALMLLAVGPTSGTVPTDGAVHVETNYM